MMPQGDFVPPAAEPYLLVPSVVSIILVSITISLRPDKAMLFVMVKACLFS